MNWPRKNPNWPSGKLCIRAVRGVWQLCAIRSLAAVVLLSLAQAPQAMALDSDKLIREAADVRAKGQYRQSIRLLTDVLADSTLSNDRRAVILNDRAMAYATLKAYDKAFDDFNASAQLFPENPALYNNRGAVLLALGLVDEAVKDLDRAVKLAPGYGTAYTNRALAELSAGRLGSALIDFRQAISVLDNKSEPLIRRAKAHLDAKRPYAALRDLNRSLSIDGRSATAFRLRADAQIMLGRNDAALEDLGQAIALAPSDPSSYLVRGRLQLSRGDYYAAADDFTKVVELDARSVEAWRNRGHAHILANEVEAAEQDLSRALELDPRSARTYAFRALLSKKMARPRQGQREIQAAEQIDADDPVVLWARGEIGEAVGDIDAAVKSYRAALAADETLVAARLGLNRLGFPPTETEVAVGNGVKDGWQLLAGRGRYYARNASLPGISVPIEPFGESVPEVVSWRIESTDDAEVGLLTVAVGSAPARANQFVPLETSAVIDLKRKRLLVTAPTKLGDVEGKLEVGSQVATLNAADGLVDRIQLVEPRSSSPSVARSDDSRRGTRSRRSSDGIPSWAPWARSDDRTTYRRSDRRTKKRRRRKTKTLFDLFN